MQRSVSCFITMSLVLLCALSIVCAAPNQKESPEEQAMIEKMAMLEKMEMMSKMEMMDHLDAAKSCAQKNNFSEAGKRLEQARTLAADNNDRTQIATAESYVSTQQSRYNEEIRVAEETRRKETARVAEEARKKAIEDTYQNAVAAYNQKDYKKSFSLYSDAASKGHALANRAMGILTAYYAKTEQDFKLADTYFAKATELGDTGAAESRQNTYQTIAAQPQAAAQTASTSGYSGGTSSYNSSSYNSSSSTYRQPSYSPPPASNIWRDNAAAQSRIDSNMNRVYNSMINRETYRNR